jgi:hypothetical protein
VDLYIHSPIRLHGVVLTFTYVLDYNRIRYFQSQFFLTLIVLVAVVLSVMS